MNFSQNLKHSLIWLSCVATFTVALSAEERAGPDWWSLQPLKVQEAPSSASNAVDAFILERLKKENLRPSPKASARVQIRRLYFDNIA